MVSTVDLRKMSQLHEAMVQQLSVRHVDLTEEQCLKKFHPKVRNHGEGPY